MVTKQQLFPDWKKALRSAIAVGLIALVSSGIAEFPPSVETLWAGGIGFILGAAAEFAWFYKRKNNVTSSKKAQTPLFLS